MRSLRVCLCTVLLSVSVQGYNFSYKSWTISGADEVSAVEGTSAVLPCTFTHPHTDHIPTGSVLWYRRKSGGEHLVFNCTYLSPDRCSGEEVTPATGRGLLRFVGNLTRRDASIMVERLSREDDDASYRCRVELNIGKLHSVVATCLTVRAAVVNVSVVTGTMGTSATLSCVFPPPALDHTLHKVTWMRKDPYRHIVAFRPQADGSWAAENGATRFELVGDPEQGNASTRIKQLSGEDSDDYLCLLDIRKRDYLRPVRPPTHNPIVHPPFIHLTEREVHLRVTAVPQMFPVMILCMPLVLKTLTLLVMYFVLYCDKVRKGGDRAIAGS